MKEKQVEERHQELWLVARRVFEQRGRVQLAVSQGTLFETQPTATMFGTLSAHTAKP